MMVMIITQYIDIIIDITNNCITQVVTIPRPCINKTLNNGVHKINYYQLWFLMNNKSDVDLHVSDLIKTFLYQTCNNHAFTRPITVEFFPQVKPHTVRRLWTKHSLIFPSDQ